MCSGAGIRSLPSMPPGTSAVVMGRKGSPWRWTPRWRTAAAVTGPGPTTAARLHTVHRGSVTTCTLLVCLLLSLALPLIPPVTLAFAVLAPLLLHVADRGRATRLD